jgi:hypothetical protein
LQYAPVSEAQFKAGPYHPPVVNVGATLHDECLNKDVTVEGQTEAPIPWPGRSRGRGRKGQRERLLPVFCGELVRAVVEEDEASVAHYWGVSLYIVNQWKKAIAGAENFGEVLVLLNMKRLDPEFRKKWGYQ